MSYPQWVIPALSSLRCDREASRYANRDFFLRLVQANPDFRLERVATGELIHPREAKRDGEIAALQVYWIAVNKLSEGKL